MSSRVAPLRIICMLMLLLLAACGGEGTETATEDPDAEATSEDDDEAGDDDAPDSDEVDASDDAPDPDEAAGTTTVRMAALPLANYTIFLAAEEQGYLAEEDIELDITYVPQGAVALEALIGESVEVAFPAHLEFVQAATQNDDLRILMGWTRLPDDGPDNTAFLVREDSGIESVADLEGRRVAAGLLNSINHFYTEIWLEENGVDPESVTFVEVPFPNMQDALDNDQVDAVFNVEPFVTVMTSGEGYRTLGRPYMEVNPGFTIIAPTVRQEWLDENPEVAEGLVRALERGAEYLREADEEELFRLVAEFTELEEDLVARMQLPIYDTTVRVDSIQRTADLALERGMIGSPVDIASKLAPTAVTD